MTHIFYSFDSKGITFIANIPYMLPRINYINIAQIPIRAIFFSLGGRINYGLDSLGGLISCYRKTNDLPWFPTYHCY